MAEYLALIYDDESKWVYGTPEADAGMAAHQQFGEKYGSAVKGGNALHGASTATTVRSDGAGGFTVTDGPFMEAKEALGGYYLIEADDLDAAVEMAKHIPTMGGAVEVRPVMVFD